MMGTHKDMHLVGVSYEHYLKESMKSVSDCVSRARHGMNYTLSATSWARQYGILSEKDAGNLDNAARAAFSTLNEDARLRAWLQAMKCVHDAPAAIEVVRSVCRMVVRSVRILGVTVYAGGEGVYVDYSCKMNRGEELYDGRAHMRTASSKEPFLPIAQDILDVVLDAAHRLARKELANRGFGDMLGHQDISNIVNKYTSHLLDRVKRMLCRIMPEHRLVAEVERLNQESRVDEFIKAAGNAIAAGVPISRLRKALDEVLLRSISEA